MKPPVAYAINRIRGMAGPGPYEARQSDASALAQSMAMPWEDAPIVDRMTMLPFGRDMAGRMRFTVPGAFTSYVNSVTGAYPLAAQYRQNPTEQNAMALESAVMDVMPAGQAAGLAFGPATGLGSGMLRRGLGATDDVAQGAARLADDVGITAYHGSPHTFDRFDMSKIGTGEGAQAYGHGLYFAESEGVAQSYRDALTAKQNLGVDSSRHIGASPSRAEQDAVRAANESMRRALSSLPPDQIPPEFRNSSGGWRNFYDYYNFRNQIRDLDAQYMASRGEEVEARIADFKARYQNDPDFKAQVDEYGIQPDWSWLRSPYQTAYRAAGRALNQTGGGSMYEVRINASPDDFLDWDKPLSEQPQAVRQAIIAATEQNNPRIAEYWRRVEGLPPEDAARIRKDMGINVFDLVDAGGAAMEAALGRGPKASAFLVEQGIPGIKYLDAGSRAAGDGSRNYVVFDDKLIEILRRYGLLPPIAAGAAATLGGNEAEAGQ